MLLQFAQVTAGHDDEEGPVPVWINPALVQHVRPFHGADHQTVLDFGGEDWYKVHGDAEDVARFIAEAMLGTLPSDTVGGFRLDLYRIPEFVPKPTGPDLEGTEFAPEGG